MTATPSPATPATSARTSPLPALRRTNAILERIPYDLIAVAARLFPAAVFWQSGRTKVDGITVTDTTFFLFEHEYALPLIPPVPAAYMATAAEHLFPLLLVLGLATRLSAIALLSMTLVIQLFVYPEAWPTHGVWAACFLLLISRGPGTLSLDRLLGIEGNGGR